MKVMLVDDEILAIQHIRKMLAWESLGFEIVCEETSPIRALQVFDQVRPQLVIVDIKMPGMNGIEFSRKLLEKEKGLKILLLTSYKEFDYAKEALKLGIQNYLLKHEVNGESLASELKRILDDWKKERLQSRMVLRKVLEDMLLDREHPKEYLQEWLSERVLPHEFHLAMILFQTDQPYPLFNSKVPEATVEDLVEMNLPMHHLTLIETIRMEANLWVILATYPVSLGKRQQREWIQTETAAIQSYLRDRCNNTISACVASNIKSERQLPILYKEMKSALQRSFFNGSGKLVIFEEEPAPKKLDSSEYISILTEASAAIRGLEIGGIHSAVHRSFSVVSLSRDYEALQLICSHWLKELRDLRGLYQLIALEEHVADSMIDSAARNTLNALEAWFILWFSDSVNAALASGSYSKKIRQAMKYIEKNYSQELTTDHIADLLNISGDHLRHLFKEETGQTLLEFLTQVRMETAKGLLLEGNTKVYQISELVGYRSSQYFSQVFRKMVGVTPNEYIRSKD